MQEPSTLFAGLMSGTSLDAIDAVIVNFSGSQPQIIASSSTSIPKNLRQKILSLIEGDSLQLTTLGTVDIKLAKLCSSAINQLVQESGLTKNSIEAIGSHGQTIYHSPNSDTPFTLQITDPNTIAARTGITTVADFRRKDIAWEGEGAPLVPAFHQACFSDQTEERAIINIGGMANITLLPSKTNQSSQLIGYDTGPGNILLDTWAQLHINKPYDHNGSWSASGQCNAKLLKLFLSDEFFAKAPPKSTGREYFNGQWITNRIKQFSAPIEPQCVQATLTDLTAQSISNAINSHPNMISEIYLCGGGCHNHQLFKRLEELNPKKKIATTAQLGIDPDMLEASAFAWLAMQAVNKQTINLMDVTGAKRACHLGGIYFGENT